MQFINKHKTDFIYFSVIALLFLFLSHVFWGKVGDIIIDCGREAYFPAEVLKGKILYKDIFNIFAPLSYQLNALLYYLWGVNISVLNVAGCINAFIVVLLMYLISRTVTSPLNSVLICFTIMIVCIFKTFIHNFIFPYSYALAYTVSSFLASVLFCIYYLTKSKPFLMIISCFFMGLSLAFKYEFTFFLLVLATIIIFFKPLSKRNILFCLLSLAFMPIVSYSILFFQGLSFTEFINSIQLILKFASTKAYNTFLYNSGGLYFNIERYKQIIPFDLRLLQYLCEYLVVFYTILLITNKIFAQKEKLRNYINVFLLSFFIEIILHNKDFTYFNQCMFPFLGFTTVFTVIITLYKFKSLKSLENIEHKDKVFLFLQVTAIIASIKAFFYTDIDGYGAFLALLPILVNFIFILDYLPRFFKFINAKTFQYTSIVIIIATCTLLFNRELNILKFFTYPIKTEKGTIYSTKQKGEAFDKTLNFIKKEVPKNSTLLVIPEGMLINFFSDRTTYNKFYCLIPNHIETFGEDNIVEELKRKPPEYIITNNLNTSWYGYKFFGKDYGFKINNFILKNYLPVKEFQSKYFSNEEDPHNNLNNLNIKIYKLKILSN